MTTNNEAVKDYFYDGSNSAKKLSNLLDDLGVKKGSETSFLEFASGYGMVTRHLIKELDPIRITCCDIHEQATHFLDSTMSVDVVLSDSLPENVKFQNSFDVVFALSFFSHMPDSSFGRWLKTLYSAVKPNGYLIFTTHGITSAKKNNCDLSAKEICFQPISEQKDLNMNEYGTSYVTSKYVDAQVKKYLHATIFSHTEASWWGHQDLYVIHKSE
jgi:cyclopropane fatty-acyl-phospholipid synthase-like methyltransferase